VNEREQGGPLPEQPDAPERREEADWPSLKPDLAGGDDADREQDPDDPRQPARTD
jgi:hypothetical protein